MTDHKSSTESPEDIRRGDTLDGKIVTDVSTTPAGRATFDVVSVATEDGKITDIATRYDK